MDLSTNFAKMQSNLILHNPGELAFFTLYGLLLRENLMYECNLRNDHAVYKVNLISVLNIMSVSILIYTYTVKITKSMYGFYLKSFDTIFTSKYYAIKNLMDLMDTNNLTSLKLYITYLLLIKLIY